MILCVILWLVALCLCSASGLIHPACYAYAGTIAPLLYAFIYLYAASKMRSLGVALILNGVLAVLLYIVGEVDLVAALVLIGLAVLSEILRKVFGYTTRKGTRISFLPLAFTFYVYSAHWWTDTAGSLAAAAEEMPAGYADKMIPVIDNTPMLIIMLVLVIPVALLSMMLAEKVLKK